MTSRLVCVPEDTAKLELVGESPTEESGVRLSSQEDPPAEGDRPSLELYRQWQEKSLDEIYAREMADVAVLEEDEEASAKMPAPDPRRVARLKVVVGTVVVGALVLLGAGASRMAGGPEGIKEAAENIGSRVTSPVDERGAAPETPVETERRDPSPSSDGTKATSGKSAAAAASPASEANEDSKQPNSTETSSSESSPSPASPDEAKGAEAEAVEAPAPAVEQTTTTSATRPQKAEPAPAPAEPPQAKQNTQPTESPTKTAESSPPSAAFRPQKLEPAASKSTGSFRPGAL